MPSLEEASRCPKCGIPGEDVGSIPGNKFGVKVHTIFCRNDRCRWFDTSWIVQVNPDGSIPERKPGPAEFPALTGGQEAAARRVLEDVEFESRRDLQTDR